MLKLKPLSSSVSELSKYGRKFSNVYEDLNGRVDVAEYSGDSNSFFQEMINLLPTYETRVVLLLQKGDQLAKETSIDEADRKQTEDDTNALRQRWDKLKTDEQDKKKR